MKSWRRKKLEIKENYIFLVLVCLVFAFGMVGLVKTENYKSDSENRTLAKFEHFTIKGFLNGSFQDNFENALSDQFVMSEKIRVWYRGMTNALPTFGIDNVVCSGKYIEVVNSTDERRATFDCDNYLLYYPKTETAGFYKNVDKYNHLNSLVDTYYYIVNDSYNTDFEKGGRSIDFVALLKENLNGKYHISELNFDTYDEYKKLFLKTDHHWNYKGSRQGFLDITDLLGLKPVEPSGTFTSEEYTFGSHANNTKIYEAGEKYTVYLYDIPEHDTVIDTKAKNSFSRLNELVEHKYNYSKNMTFYSFYGYSSGEVFLDFHQPNKENLLIISNSFSNPLNELIAQFFNKTYIIDLRNYEKRMGEDFVLSDYLKEYKIDKALVIANPYFLTDVASNKGLEA